MTVQKMYDDLDYWIFLGIGEDIVMLPYQRKEYQHLVSKAQALLKQSKDDNKTVAWVVLKMLEYELTKPTLLRPTFWRLNWLWLKSKIALF